MKKKITLLLTVTVLAMSILAGCGSKNASSSVGNPTGEGSDAGSETAGGEITISEAINDAIKENGGSIYIYSAYTSNYSIEQMISSEIAGTVTTHFIKYDGSNALSYDGNGVELGNIENDDKTLDEKTEEYISKAKSESYASQLYLYTQDEDGDGEIDDEYEVLGMNDGVGTTDAEDNGCLVTFKNDEGVYHVTIKGVSYMVIRGSYSILIKDTNYTKDKTIVYDSNVDESNAVKGWRHKDVAGNGEQIELYTPVSK